jgi:hypothetical protein
MAVEPGADLRVLVGGVVVEDGMNVNGGVKTSHVAAQKSTTSGYLERAMETG